MEFKNSENEVGAVVDLEIGGVSKRGRFGSVEVLQERDKQIMIVTYEEQFLLLKQVAKYFFKESFQSASLRIIKLVNLRLLKYETLSLPGKPKVIRLTPKGVKLCKEISPFSIMQKRKVSLSTLNHDAFVSEARLILRDRFDASWIPEKAMKLHNLKKIPDGILLFQSGKRIAIEVENSVKGKDRYDHMWREWEQQEFVLVLYVATTEVVYRALQKRMAEHQSQKVRLGLIRFADLLNGSNESVWTPRGLVSLFSRRAF